VGETPRSGADGGHSVGRLPGSTHHLERGYRPGMRRAERKGGEHEERHGEKRRRAKSTCPSVIRHPLVAVAEGNDLAAEVLRAQTRPHVVDEGMALLPSSTACYSSRGGGF
jgi:hypothetical protein